MGQRPAADCCIPELMKLQEVILQRRKIPESQFDQTKPLH
jgi:hypothetical protein